MVLPLAAGAAGGSFMPSLTGGTAGPSSAEAVGGDDRTIFGSSFSVAGSGGSTASANSNPAGAAGSDQFNLLLMGGAILIAILITRKK